MRLTTRGRYAVTAMLDLALHYDRGPVSLAAIAERQGISQSYLEQLFARLRRNGLVDGLRGPRRSTPRAAAASATATASSAA
jgi:Rrf2 family iron-sulfur cluster assembly transcriptional regulator